MAVVDKLMHLFSDRNKYSLSLSRNLSFKTPGLFLPLTMLY